LNVATPDGWVRLRRIIVAIVVVGCASDVLLAAFERNQIVASFGSTPTSLLKPAPTPRHLGIPRLGVDYYAPNSYSNCPNWTWLETRCFNPSGSPTPASGDPGRYVLNSDLRFVRNADIGRFMRVWAPIDQLMKTSKNGEFEGLRHDRVRNLDQALAIFAHRGFRVDLVLLSYSEGDHARNQFKPQALNGSRPWMRLGYLAALRQVIHHLAANRLDRKAVRVIDLQNEAYYQLERYFADPAHLGMFGQCKTSATTVSTQCVDQLIIHHWLIALYGAARSASHHFLYTESDTGRLLTTDPADQRYWIHMYPVDVYDIHLYDSHPWMEPRARWISALNLQKPWFSGEIGCSSGATGCTYNGSRAAAVDRWWLMNMPDFRAQSLLLEDGYPTVWTYRAANPSQTLTTTGRMMQCQVSAERQGCGAFS
jgi:hypothetical protein